MRPLNPEIEQKLVEIDEDTPIYYVLQKTWNRNVIFGPHKELRAMEMAINHANNTNKQGRRGPVEFIQLTANLGRWRVVVGKDLKTVLEKRIRTLRRKN